MRRMRLSQNILALHSPPKYFQGVDFFESNNLLGHTIGSNQEKYAEQNILTLTLSGVYALNGWVYDTPNKSYPRFNFLVPHVI